MSLNHLIKRQSRTPVTVTRQILFSLVGVNMLVTVLFSAAFYVKQKKTVITDMDSTLRAVVTLARETLPSDYHDRITGASSVSDGEFLKIVDRNNRLCVALGLEYIWSLMEVDGRIVFTTSTSPDKISDNRNHAAFFELHSNPEFYLPIFESMVPTYRNCYDKWGQIRACLIPYTDVHGRKYLFGSSYRLTEVDRQLRMILWRVTGLGLTLFAISMVVGSWVTRRITRPIDQLTSTIQGIVAGQRDLVAEERGSREQVLLVRQFNVMNRAIQEKISELEMARGQLVELYSLERKQNEEERVLSEQRYRGLLNFAVDGILVGSHEGIIIEANERMCLLFGMHKNELIGKHLTEMPFTRESVQRVPFQFELLHKGDMVVSERTIRRSDGSEIVVEMHTKMMADGTYQSIYHDISKRKQTQEKLRINEQRYRDILNFAVDGILICCHEGIIIEANERMLELCGLELSELVGHSIFAMPFTPESVLAKPLRIDLVEKGETVVSERTVRRRDGSEVVVEMHTKTMPDGNHQSIWYDITQRKQTEALLIETRRLLDETQRIARVGGWAIDFNTGNAAWTEEVYHIYGVGADFNINDRDLVFSFYDPEQTPILKRALNEGVEQGKSFDLECGFIRADGKHIWVRVMGQPTLVNGRIVKVNGCLMDITERKQAELALRDSENRYRQLFEMESDAIFLVDSEVGQILDVNLAAQTLYGYSREDLLSKRNVDLSAEPEQTRHRTRKAEKDLVPLIRIALRKHRKSDGSVFPFEITARAFTLNGRRVLIAAIRDITQRVKAQELMASWNVALEKRVVERTAEAERRTGQLHRLTGRLIRAEEDERKRISDVLHDDLQQTLVAARMTLGIVIQSVKRVTAVEALQQVDGMLSQSIRLTRNLVQEIAVPAVKEGDLPVAIGWIAQQMQDRFGLLVELTVGEGLPSVSENVYHCLYRAVQELLFNVVKHANTRQAEVSVGLCEGGLVRVAVTDRGAGFSTASLAMEGKKDVGIGLHRIRERIEGLGGHIEVVSAEGEGTRVVVTVPAHNGAQETGLPLTGLSATVNHEG